jgi:hypothetical protein
MAQRAIRIYVLLAMASLLLVGLLFAQPASPTLAGFTPTPKSHEGGGGNGGGGGGGSTPPPSKRVVPPPTVVIAEATIVAPTPLAPPILTTVASTPSILPITGGSIDDESPMADQAPQDAALTPEAQPIYIVVPPEWMPAPSQATLIIINEAGGDIVFTMGDQERRLPPHTKAAIMRPAGRYGFTVTDPRFQPYRSDCDLAGDSIYSWYTDDSMNSDRCVRIGP